MKKILILAIALLVMPFAYAEVEVVDAGITPDSQLYAFDVALDNLMLRFQFSNEARVQRGLKIAEERLAETNEMIKLEKFEEAQKSQEQHQIRIQEMELVLAEVETEEAVERLQLRIQAHEQKIEAVKNQYQSSEALQIMNQIQNRFQEANVVAEERATQLKQGGNQ